jgi:hypothetical protein
MAAYAYRHRRSGGPVVAAVAVAAVLAVSGARASADRRTPPPRATSSSPAGYVNPLAGERWTLARTDQGVDYKPAVPEPVRAIGAGTVVFSSTTYCLPHGWPGCAEIAYKLTSGPLAGNVIYVAEHLKGLLPRGSFKAGTVIATALPGYPWTEWGWANCAGTGPAVQYDGAPDGTPMPGGLAFARFMRGLGAGSAQDPGPGPDVVRSC